MLTSASNKRVILIYWKNKPENQFEIFSNLKNFCLSYKEYNYNTISNYLSKDKIAYDNKDIRIERKNVILKPKEANKVFERKIVPVMRKVLLSEANDRVYDLDYWLSKPIKDRAAAVTHIISQSLTAGQRIDKLRVIKKPMK
jgi:hypothetical protein